MLGTAPAHAKMDYNKDFPEFWKRTDLDGGQKLDGTKLADVQHNALRGDDACQAGDDITPHGVWDKFLADMNKK